MSRLSRILAALDSSRASRRAFDYALALSKQSGAELIVVHAVPRKQAIDQDADSHPAWTSKLRLRADYAGVPFSVKIQHGDPAEAVLLHAETLRPDVIIVGTHQPRRGLDRLRGGSVAERIASKATVPVLLIPPYGAEATSRLFSHVAVGVDFGPASAPAIERALGVARDPGDRVTLLHVVPGFSEGIPPHYYRFGMAEYQTGLVRDARRRLKEAVPAGGQPAAGLDTMVLVGDVPEEISQVLSRIDADLLIVGVSKRGPVSRALFGTTAARLISRLRVPMLAVPDTAAASHGEAGAAHKLAA